MVKIRILFLMGLIFCAFQVIAETKVVVIPLSGDDLKPLANIVTVAKSNGDFNNPAAALASIGNATASNPYLVVIAPGVYNIGSSQMIMKDYVDVTGSGRNSTFIVGSVGGMNSGSRIGDAIALLVAANNSSLSDLTLENTYSQGSEFSNGISVDQKSTSISNVDIKMSGSSDQIGLYLGGGLGEALISDVAIDVSNGGQNYGIQTHGQAQARLHNVDVNITAGTDLVGMEISTSSNAGIIVQG